MENDHIEHFGVIGMRWGTRRGQKQTDTLAKRVGTSMKKYDRGSTRVDIDTFREHSRKARRLTYNADRRIVRMNKYLNQVKTESVNNKVIKWNKNPEKVKKVKDYLERSQVQSKRLSEIRSNLIDIKLDVL